MKEPSSFPEDHIAHWPEEIKKAYERLQIPSLYDLLLANEKLSLELRKHNREVKSMTEVIQTLSFQVNSLTEMMSEEWEELEEEGGALHQEIEGALQEELEDINEEFEEELTNLQIAVFNEGQDEGARLILMTTTDELLELSRSTKLLTSQLSYLLPHKEEGSKNTRSTQPLAEELIQSLVDNVETVRYKLMGHLEDFDIQVIEPQPGEPLASKKHRVLEKVKGEGKPNTIARVIRVGFLQEDEVLRQADVAIYTSN